MSSSGGGLPGRLDLARDRGVRYLGRKTVRSQVLGLSVRPQVFAYRLRPRTYHLRPDISQLVEIVKLTVIFA